MSSSPHNFYQPEQTETTHREILRRVRQVEIRTRRYVTDAMVGSYHSAFKGRGMDFAEVRAYTPGDDVRSIDWNVTAKTGEPFIKVFEEERELTIMLVIDLSASQHFGSSEQSKRELAAELASVLAFSATRNNDKVGLLILTDRVEKFIVPKKGHQHVLRLIREILFFQPENQGTNLPEALRHLNRMLRQRAIVFLLSDFLTPETLQPDPGKGDLAQMLRVTGRRHDLVGVHCVDPREGALPDIGWMTLEDMETGQLVEINTSSSHVRREYARRYGAYRLGLQRLFRSCGMDVIEISSGKDTVGALRQFFQQREARR